MVRSAALERVIVSAPFGNYIQPEGTTPTLGTFTAERRRGRVRRFLRTVRYYPRIGAWVNAVGLRNPGIGWLRHRVETGRLDPADKIVSIHGFDAEEWATLLEHVRAIRPLAVELNISCPNVGEVSWPDGLFRDAVATGLPVIVKVPPVGYDRLFEQAFADGVRRFHCCNTLPVAAGGISGQPLKPLSLQCIRHCLATLTAEQRTMAEFIGGGGIRTVADVRDYAAAGAHRVALGTRLMNPLHLLTHAAIRPLIDGAAEAIE